MGRSSWCLCALISNNLVNLEANKSLKLNLVNLEVNKCSN